MLSKTWRSARCLPAIVTFWENTAALTCSAIKSGMNVLSLIAHSSFCRRCPPRTLQIRGKFIPCLVVLVLKKECQNLFVHPAIAVPGPDPGRLFLDGAFIPDLIGYSFADRNLLPCDAELYAARGFQRSKHILKTAAHWQYSAKPADRYAAFVNDLKV